MPEPEPDQDPFLAALLDEVLADHDDLPAEVLDEMRWLLELAAATHPLALGIVNRSRPRKEPVRSGEQDSPGAPLVDSRSGHPARGGGEREGTDG